MKRVLIMAGGTGGHIFPGLAVADYFRQQGIEVSWIGTQSGLESRLVPEAGFPLHLINISGLRGKGWKPILTAPIKIMAAIWQARRVIKTINPDLVIGMGGFVSGPGGVATWLLRCPLIIHEQNAKAGLTNRWLSLFATRVLQGFPGAFKAQPKVVTTGNPVRAEIIALPSPNERHPHSPLHLLVLGGSLGASALNEIVPRALAALPEQDRPLVYHQTGEKHFETAKKAYQVNGLEANLHPFIKDMDQAYSWADVVLCRAGALTVAELCAAGLGAILVPFPHAVDDHQTANADYMAKKQAAILIQQSALTSDGLADILSAFSKSPEKCQAMAMAAYALRQEHVVNKIFQISKEIGL